MMKIDNLNMVLTCVSILTTIISTLATLISVYQASRAKKYKEQVKDVLRTVDIIEISRDFEKIATKFISDTRADDWYKGRYSQYTINPLIDILIKLPSIYELVDEMYSIKNKVHDLNKNLVGYETANKIIKKNTNGLILEIQEILQNTIKIQLNKL